MKIALLQCNPSQNNLQKNIEDLARMTIEADADLCIGACGSLGAPLQGACSEAEKSKYLARLAGAISSRALLCGFACSDPFLISEGMMLQTGTEFYFKGLRFGLTSANSLIGATCDCLLALTPWPYSPYCQETKEKAYSRRLPGIPLISVNLAGGEGSWVFNGQSFALNPDGTVSVRARPFQRDTVFFDTDVELRAPALKENLDATQWGALVTGVRDFFQKNNCRNAVLGLSGGMDSAFVACIAAEALGADHVVAVLMPSPYSSPGSVQDAYALAKNLGINTIELPIANIMEVYKELLSPLFEELPQFSGDVTFENLQARIRGVLLMAIANRTQALVLNTGNKSEIAMGYSTLYGDSVGALAVIGDLYKTRVYELAAWFNKKKEIIPQEIFDKAPSAELRPDQKDSDTLPEYNILDPILEDIFTGKADAQDTRVCEIRNRIMANQFKRRQSPPPLLVSGNPIEAWENPMRNCRASLV